jgi:hypothetical protein
MTVLLYPPDMVSIKGATRLSLSIKGVDDMVSIKGVDDMVPKATGKAQFLVIFCMYSFSLGHDGSPISSGYGLDQGG